MNGPGTVEQREPISRDELVTRLWQVTGSQFVSLRARTELRMKKTANPFFGRVEKIAHMRGQICFNYENSVNAAREKSGDPSEFIAGPRMWGTRIQGTCLVEHNGGHYVEVKCGQLSAPEYFLDGAAVTAEQMAELKPFIPVKSDTEIMVRTYKIASIIWFNFGGREFSVHA